MIRHSRRRSRFAIVALVAIVACLAIFGHRFASASEHSDDGDVNVVFNHITIESGEEVHGDLNVVFGKATCEGGAQIDGNVHTVFGKFVQLEGCQVNGTVTGTFGDESAQAFLPSFVPMSSDDFVERNSRVLQNLAWDVVVLFAFLLFPMRVRVALDRVESHPGLSFATGSMAVIGALPLAILLLISVIGLPLIPLEIAALFAGSWIGYAAVALLIGRRLYELLRPHTTPSPLGALAFGLIVITAAESLPLVGWAVWLLVWLVGLGAALLAFVRETSFRSFIGAPAFTAPSVPGGSPPPPPGPPMRL